ncbi:uncharacterized protein LOC124273088 isoform X2 [Haliotis rubra]|uniref:uncharacterized protein LOC124273088 isoform X2 n=1 Tax=Haliotis rubra TaxID=36100 RepID=UPI001EE5BF04|nr:uncharacterized protein LOC124273088 isoform X2 [Haliotis rubra]
MSSLASSVNNISVPHPNSAKSPSTVPTKSPTPGLTVTKKDNVPEVDEEVEAGSLPGFPTWATVLITLVALILIAIITILGSMWWFRRLRTNGPTRMPSNSSISRDSTDSGGGHPSTQPPPYSQINHTSGSQDQPCPNNENTGYCNGGTPERCPNQRARPFQNCRYDTPSEHPINYASLSFEPGQQSSTSSFHLSSNGFSSGSSGPLDRVSVPGQAPDQTDKKVAAGGRESAGENQRVVTKPPSGVVPVGEEEEEEEAALLRSAPSLDPDSIKDSQ